MDRKKLNSKKRNPYKDVSQSILESGNTKIILDGDNSKLLVYKKGELINIFNLNIEDGIMFKSSNIYGIIKNYKFVTNSGFKMLLRTFYDTGVLIDDLGLFRGNLYH